MSKLNAIINDDIIGEIRRSSESAARGPIEKLLPYSEEHLLRFQSIIFAQYITQFSVQTFVKENSVVENRMFTTIKRTILTLTNDQITLVIHPAQTIAKTVSSIIMSQTANTIFSKILMLDQLSAFQNIDDAKLIEIYPKMSFLLDELIVECKSKIKNSKHNKKPKQMSLFAKNPNNASISDNESTLRNTTVKK